MRLSKRRAGMAVIAIIGCVVTLPAPPARALTITVNYEGTVPAAAKTAFNTVKSLYEHTFVNPIDVKIDVRFGTVALGATSSNFISMSYADWKTDMSNTSALYPLNTYLNTAKGTLPANDPIGLGTGNGVVYVRAANAKAIGVTAGQTTGTFPNSINGAYDAVLTFTDAANTFEYNGVGVADKYDFMDAASHELNEALGSGSQLTNIANNAVLGANTAFEPEDYFRYDASGSRSITTDPNAAVYFTYDPSLAVYLDRFNQDNNKGDRNDWIWGNFGVPASTIEVQSAVMWQNQIAPLLSPSPATPEFVVLSTLGYSVPEPSTYALAFCGLASLALARRWTRGRN